MILIDGKNNFITFEYSNIKDKKYNLLNSDPWNWKHRFKLEYSVRLSDYSMYNTLIVSNLDGSRSMVSLVSVVTNDCLNSN